MAVICHQLSAISLSLHNFTILPQSRRYSTPPGSCHWVHVFLLTYDLYEVTSCFYGHEPTANSYLPFASIHDFTVLPQSRRYSTPSGSCHWVHAFLLKYDLYEVNCCFYSQQPSAISFNSRTTNHPSTTSRVIITIKPIIKPNVARSEFLFCRASGITSSTTTNIMAPAANESA